MPDSDTPAAQPVSRTVPYGLILATVWLIAFGIFFFTRTLPNAQTLEDGSRPTRDLVWQVIGTILLDDLLPIREPGSAPAGIKYLSQRIPFLLIAGGVYLLAYLLGTGLFHAIGVNIKILGRMEWHALAVAVGISGLSLITLFLGYFIGLYAWLFWLTYCLIVLFWAAMHARAAGSFSTWQGRLKSWFLLKYFKWSQATFRWSSPRVWGSLLVAPFLLTILLGAMLPSVDFDVKEYHFGGPKEYYQAGQIYFLPHNVYTSFPFLTEMLTLTGMVLMGDWYWGAVAGKTILCGFAPMSAILIGVLVRRWLGTTAGWLAAVVFLTIPWTYRMSIIAYTEGGLSLYVAASLLATQVVVLQLQKRKTALPVIGITGFLAGSAAACKYPGLISVTIPISLLIAIAYVRAVSFGLRSKTHFAQAAGIFVLGTILSFGPWLLKNTYETGNPVYPLLYSVFGGADWNAELDAKWKRAHSPDHRDVTRIGQSFQDVFVLNDWQSPLILGFGLVGACAYFRELRSIRWLLIYLVWFFGTWWALTHRIDRFWVPMLPAASCLAGAGAFWLMQRSRWLLAFCLLPTLVYHQAFITTELCGYNAYVIDLQAARQMTARITSPEVVYLNQYMPNRPGKVLCVGEAELFDATFPYLYNTVFDISLLEQYVSAGPLGSAQAELLPTETIRENFRQQKVTYLLVNWQEILRYRTTYGYTDFVNPKRMNELLMHGLLSPALGQTPFYQPAEALSEQQRQEVETWAPELIVEIKGKTYFTTTQIFPVP